MNNISYFWKKQFSLMHPVSHHLFLSLFLTSLSDLYSSSLENKKMNIFYISLIKKVQKWSSQKFLKNKKNEKRKTKKKHEKFK